MEWRVLSYSPFNLGPILAFVTLVILYAFGIQRDLMILLVRILVLVAILSHAVLGTTFYKTVREPAPRIKKRVIVVYIAVLLVAFFILAGVVNILVT